LLKASFGAAYVPPPCGGVFQDASCGEADAAWIEDAFHRGWMDACLVKGNQRWFCPARQEPRATAAEEDARTFRIVPCPQ
jgi:hypothetical protein